MDAYTTVFTDLQTIAIFYDACVDLEIGQLNGDSMVYPTVLSPSGSPSCGNEWTSKSGSVAATPGRQYYAQSLPIMRARFSYAEQVPAPGCGPYCGEFWYDVAGYGFLPTTPPPIEDWSPIYYVYADVPAVPRASGTQEITVLGSYATAWSPPRIDSVTPSSWPAGETTTFTIVGEGFGYSPELVIQGVGITAYTNSCASASLPGCNTQIVATVSIDASTAGGTVENIRVTAGGLNLSGFLPVEIAGQLGQATATAATLQYNPPAPRIMLGTNSGGNLCSTGTNVAGTTQNVVIGQQIAFTGCIPDTVPSIQLANVSWSPSSPHGVAVGGYTASTESGAVVPLSSPLCSAWQRSCDFPKFYWVTPGTSLTFTFTYEHCCGTSRSASITFNVSGPTNVGISVTPTPLNRDLIQVVKANPLVLGTDRQVLVFGSNVPGGQKGIKLDASASLPNGNQGEYSWIQLLTTRNIRFSNAEGRWLCPLDESPQHDGVYHPDLHKGPTFVDSPWSPLPMSVNEAETQGEVADSFAATAHLMWKPNPASGCDGEHCTILVPLAKLNWSWSGDAINTLVGQPNGTTWLLAGCQGCSNESAQHTTLHPVWRSSMGAPAGCLPRKIQ